MKFTDLEFFVAWSEDDGEWACVTEAFPSLSWLAADPEAAIAGYVELLKKDGELVT